MQIHPSLRTVKLVHTLAWVFFVACILAIPLFTFVDRYGVAGLFVGVVAIEVVILLLNDMRCPLTDVAARYTSDRRPNFDIYLPEWLARHNKSVFGTLYFAATFYLLGAWLGYL